MVSFPTETDFITVKYADGTPADNFAIVCGVESVALTETANTTDKFRRDCEKPGTVPVRRVKVTGTQWGFTASGVADMATIPAIRSAFAQNRNYIVECLADDGTDGGKLLGTFGGEAILTGNNKSFSREEGTVEFTFEGQDNLTYTPAPA